jgi:hypothetical protein
MAAAQGHAGTNRAGEGALEPPGRTRTRDSAAISLELLHGCPHCLLEFFPGRHGASSPQEQHHKGPTTAPLLRTYRRGIGLVPPARSVTAYGVT